MREGKVNVALLVQVSKQILAGLEFEELSRYALCLVVHSAHPLARSRKVSLEQVAQKRLVTYCVAHYPEYHIWLARLFPKVKRGPQIAEEHEGPTSLIAAVDAGRGVALVRCPDPPPQSLDFPDPRFCQSTVSKSAQVHKTIDNSGGRDRDRTCKDCSIGS